ncbi:hypothetical protein N2152v2_002776 [Parachlorella kessleri]
MRGAATQTTAATAGEHSGALPQKFIRLAIVGDVHGQWDADSEAALDSLAADVAVFLGDFGEEDVEIIQRIAGVRHRKAVILGNHDAWYSLTERGRARLARKLAGAQSAALLPGAPGPSPFKNPSHGAGAAAAAPPAVGVAAQGGTRADAGAPTAAAASSGRSSRPVPAAAAGGGSSSGSVGGGAVTPGVARQLELLREAHVGCSAAHFPDLNLSIVGGRPFTKGGKQWSDVAAFYQDLYGVASPADSARRIVAAAASQPEGCVRVLAAHNGPAGLGAARHDMCGVDWLAGEGDHGDPDLQAALAALHHQGVPVPLVLFGHMHSTLKGGGQRNMAHVDPVTGTVLLNCAVVPRIRRFTVPREQARAARPPGAGKLDLARSAAASLGDGLAEGRGRAGEGGRYENGHVAGGGQGQRQQHQGAVKQGSADRSPKRSRALAAGQQQQQQQYGVVAQQPQGGVTLQQQLTVTDQHRGSHVTGDGQGDSLSVEWQPASRPGQPSQQRVHALQSQQEQQHGQQPGTAGVDSVIEGRAHHFVVVELDPSGAVLSARNVWVGVAKLDTGSEPPAGSGYSAGHAAGSETPAGSSHNAGLGTCGQAPKQCFVLEEQDLVLLRTQAAESENDETSGEAGMFVGEGQVLTGRAAGAALYEVYKAHEGRWETVQCGGMAGQRRGLVVGS